jgi:hypothetical protein
VPTPKAVEGAKTGFAKFKGYLDGLDLKSFMGAELAQAEATIKRAKTSKFEAAVVAQLAECTSVETNRSFVTKKTSKAGDVMGVVFPPLAEHLKNLVAGSAAAAGSSSSSKAKKK